MVTSPVHPPPQGFCEAQGTQDFITIKHRLNVQGIQGLHPANKAAVNTLHWKPEACAPLLQDAGAGFLRSSPLVALDVMTNASFVFFPLRAPTNQ